MLIEEYKRSLKMPEAEEVFDLIFYRPLGFLFVKLIYRSPITPNQVTILSMAAGLASAWYLSAGTSASLLWAGYLYAMANILDCSDGQLARLQNSGTPLGRLVDGVADYISSVAIFLGIGFGLAGNGNGMWRLVIAAGVSSALHAMMFDQYQNEFISTVRGEKNFLDKEIERFENEIRGRKDEHRRGLMYVVLNLYLSYLNIQKQSNTKRERRYVDPELYRASNLLMIRLWSFLGPTTNRTILIISALFGRVDAFLWMIVIPGNLWLAYCYLIQKRIHKRLERPLQ